MAYNQELANSILQAAYDKFPDAIPGFPDLQQRTGRTGKPWDDDWRLAIDALQQRGLITIDHPVEPGSIKKARGFIALRITEVGRNAVKKVA